MKVVQLVPALELGGVERGTLEIARALVDAGHESLVISAGGRLVPQLEAEGSRHIEWDLGKKSLLTFLKVRSFRRWLEKEAPDIIHARSRMPAWIAWLAWRSMDPNNRPHFVTTLHGMHSVNAYSAIMGRGERVIAVSETARDYLMENYSVEAERIEVIHRGVDPADFPRGFKPSDQWLDRFYTEHPTVVGKKLLCFPGRITRWKGHLDLIQVLVALKQKRDDFHVLIIGDDPKGKFILEVREAIARENLDADVSFLGTRSDMRELYALSDLMLSLTTTTAEAFGRTVVECCAIGTPVVAYKHGAVAETLRVLFPKGLVKAGNAEEAASRVDELLDAPPEIPVNPFTLHKMQQQTLSLYSALLNQG